MRLPRATYYRRRAASARARKGPWPAPVRDRISSAAAAYALEWPAWGHRKIAALMQADGFQVSEATVKRALRARGLLQPVGYQRERRQLAAARRAAFLVAPVRRNRVWQTDFSEIETLAGGVWRMGGIADYVSKLSLACPVSTTQTWRDAVEAIEQARQTVHELLGRPLLDDCVNPTTGEIEPVIVVSDNGPCYKAAGFARYIRSRPELRHVRTRHKAPETNGVIERFYGSLKYEHLYRHEIFDGLSLAELVDGYRDVYNRIRPHEALGMKRPLEAFLAEPKPHPAEAESVSIT